MIDSADAATDADWLEATPVDENTAGGPLELLLQVSDPELIAELAGHPEGRARQDYALTALRIGVLALRQARGRIDADTLRAEGDRMVTELEGQLSQHRQSVTLQVSSSLKEYFDPQSGRFNERVERLLRKDGELEQVLQRQVAAEDSELARTLAAHFGETSPLMRMLSPDESKGLLAALRQSLEEALRNQRETILREFSLDNREGALSRLVTELGQRQGKLTEDLQGSVKEVVGEFSLDNEDSALSRLVRRVEQTEKQISSEFSLDTETSALARMRKELLQVLGDYREESRKFQQEVREALVGMQARREQADRSTTHGNEFEAELLQFVRRVTQESGDLTTHVANTTGLIRHSKVGDLLVELGPEQLAAGAKIVIEAKESGGYDLAKAREEIDTARKNRAADVGLFVFSRRTAPSGLDGLLRHGDDVFAVWDATDPSGDVYLKAGLSLARALCTRSASRRAVQQADFEAIERALRTVEKQSQGLDEITRLTGTIQSNSAKVLDRARIMRETLEREIGTLDEKVDELRQVMAGDGAA